MVRHVGFSSVSYLQVHVHVLYPHELSGDATNLLLEPRNGEIPVRRNPSQCPAPYGHWMVTLDSSRVIQCPNTAGQ